MKSLGRTLRIFLYLVSAVPLGMTSSFARADVMAPDRPLVFVAQFGLPIVKMSTYFNIDTHYYAGASLYVSIFSNGGTIEFGKLLDESSTITRYALLLDLSEHGGSSEFGGPSQSYSLLATMNRQNLWEGSRHFGWTYALSAGYGYRDHSYDNTKDQWSPVVDASIGLFIRTR